MAENIKLGKVGERPFWIRTGSVFVRAAHLLAASAVLGACLWGVEGRGLHAWWLCAGISGVLLVIAEFVKHLELYREVAGWSTLLKLVVLACCFVVPVGAPWLMAGAFVIAVVGAHSPRVWRHRRLF